MSEDLDGISAIMHYTVLLLRLEKQVKGGEAYFKITFLKCFVTTEK